MSTDRKADHIDLALKSSLPPLPPDSRFDYEPLLKGHPTANTMATPFMGKMLKAPFWISSMTGGTKMAGVINRRLARVASEFGLGMGLGSCRPLLHSRKNWDDFNLRPILGPNVPFFINLGISQIQVLIHQCQLGKIDTLVKELDADGLIVHLNPLQEFFQPEGDRLELSGIEVIEILLQEIQVPLVVKEVGQGMGPRSLKALLELPLAAIELAAYGGTNFSQIEQRRSNKKLSPLTWVGHDAQEMVALLKALIEKMGTAVKCSHFIISGGVRDFLDGHYLQKKLAYPSLIGQASAYLAHAVKGDFEVRQFAREQIEGLAMARQFLHLKQ